MKLHKLIDIETTSSIEGPDAPIAQGTRISRPNRNRSTVYSVRLSPDEVASVQELADEAGLPSSTLVRSWIVERLWSEQEEIGLAESELLAAQQHLALLHRYLAGRAAG